jgi:DNA ligase D-like protein (predicted polymerase)/DNA ligase D-like protein (predicted 3'-phosphoesterase)
MNLTKYQEKRSFDKTPEPTGGKADKDILRFVIQKHAASHLHYDFRLEMRGVLKSWAVPKGPSTDPAIKRLAMMVEDHPYDYRNFEGIIPAGQYGGGTVIVWDEGTYEVSEPKGKDKKAQEKELLSQLYSGKLKFVLKGKKLRGEFALVKAYGRGENAWLLIKLEDKYASEKDILLKDKSVVSRLSLEHVAATSKNIYGQKKSLAEAGTGSASKTGSGRKPAQNTLRKPKLSTELSKLLKAAKYTPLPADVLPMLANRAQKPGEGQDLVYEVNWQGQRCLATIDGEEVKLVSDKGRSLNKKYNPILEAIGLLPFHALLDGEIVILDTDGLADTSALKSWKSPEDGELVYYVYDILWLDGKDLCPLPLHARQSVLQELLVSEEGTIRLSNSFQSTPAEFIAVASRLGFESIIAKKRDSIYLPGEKTKDWQIISVTYEKVNNKSARKAEPEASTNTKRNKGKQPKADIVAAATKGAPLLNPTDEMQIARVNGHDLKFNNLSKLYWPEDGVSKRDMINYYHEIAPYMLPYLKNRPMSLNRHPNGITGKGFYQKDVTGKVPDWIETMPYRSDSDPAQRNFLVCQNEASLLYMASLGCIEMNPWSSTVKKPDHPDWCVIDLDPGKTTFEQIIQAAQVTKVILDSLGVASYCKTSGSKGLHVYVPLGGKYSYEQSKEFARVVATLVQKELPKFTSIERAVAGRNGKMYIDFLQNRPQATLAAPYSLRPKPGATVSMPLHWEEVKKGLTMRDFTIHNAVARVKAEGDLFKPVLGKGLDLAKVVRQLSKV